MCKWLTNLFKKKLTGAIPPALVLPHPEEPGNPQATAAAVNIIAVRQAWYDGWRVSLNGRGLFNPVTLNLVENLAIVYNGALVKVPAATYAELLRIDIDPKWANPGVLAHESQHIFYSWLTEDQRLKFAAEYFGMAETGDAMLSLVVRHMAGRDPSWVSDIREIYADIYRYLGDKMPESLKPFFPNMI